MQVPTVVCLFGPFRANGSRWARTQGGAALCPGLNCLSPLDYRDTSRCECGQSARLLRFAPNGYAAKHFETVLTVQG